MEEREQENEEGGGRRRRRRSLFCNLLSVRGKRRRWWKEMGGYVWLVSLICFFSCYFLYITVVAVVAVGEGKTPGSWFDGRFSRFPAKHTHIPGDAIHCIFVSLRLFKDLFFYLVLSCCCYHFDSTWIMYPLRTSSTRCKWEIWP